MTLEERIAALEKKNIKSMGMINALTTILCHATAWSYSSTPEGVQKFQDLKTELLLKADIPARNFVGVNPALLDAISAENELALKQLLESLTPMIQYLASTRAQKTDHQ